MANNTEKRITAKMVLDSTGYNDKLKGLNAEMKKHQSELKLASEGIKTFGKDSEKLKSVQESLSKQVELHSKKVDLYKQSMEKATSKMQDNIKERDKLKSSLDAANKKYEEAVKLYGKESTEAKKAKEEVDKLTEEHKKAEKAVESNAKQIQNYETNMNKSSIEMIKVQGELKKVSSELDTNKSKWTQANEKLKESSERFKAIGEKVSGVGDKILKFTAPLAAGGIASLKFTTDFSDGMAKVSTIADATKVPIDKLRQGALKLSKDFGVGATEITESMYQAISASVPTEKAVNFVAVATKAAKGGFTDAATAVDGLSTVLNSYGIEASKADEIANQMLITQNKGKTSFGELASAVGKVTPLAANLGITTEELFSSLASTTAQGLATSESVTALKASMSNIIKPSKEAGEAAELLGIEFNASALKSKGWKNFLLEIKDAMKNSSPVVKTLTEAMDQNAQKMDKLRNAGKENSSEFKKLVKSQQELRENMLQLAEAQDSPLTGFAKMFGSVEGLNSILMLTSENGMSIYNDTMQEMKTNTTALDDAFKKMSETPGEKFKKALNSMKVAAIKFGDALVPMFEKGTNIISKFADKLGSLSKEQLESIAKWGMLSIATGGALKVVGGGISTIGTIAGGISKLTGLIGTATTATATVGTAASVAGGATGLGALVGGLGSAAVAVAPFVAGAAAIGVAAYGIHKHMSEEAVPSVDLFADKVEHTTETVTTASGELENQMVTTTTKISEETKKAVGSYMDLDKGATQSLTNMYTSMTVLTDTNTKNLVSTYDQMNQQIKDGFDKHYQERTTNLQKFFAESTEMTDKEEAEILAKEKLSNDERKASQEEYHKKIKGILERASKEKRVLTADEVKEINGYQENMRQNAVTTLSKEEVESKVLMERLKSNSTRLTAETASNVIKNAEKQRKESVEKAEKQHDDTVAQIIRMRDETGTITAEQADKLIKEADRQRDQSINKAELMKDGVVEQIKRMNSDVLEDIDTSDGSIKDRWTKLKEFFSNNPITRMIKTVMENSQKELEGADSNWTGNNYFKGGLTYLHDAPGKNNNYELYDLPQGTRIFNHDASQDLVMQTAEQVATKVANSVLSSFNGNNGINVTQNIYTPTASPSEVARQTKNSLRELSLQW